MKLKTNADCAVMFICGQSNAHGHNQRLEDEDIITTPMKNVFSMDRIPNMDFNISKPVWSGYTTYGKNLGEIQDNTYSLAYFTAKKWQQRIDNVENLPDLYIIQMSIGGEGILKGMWNPQKKPIMLQSTLAYVDISLYPWALKVFSTAMNNLRATFENPVCIGFHWLGSEEDTRVNLEQYPDYKKTYHDFFASMLKAIGQPCPFYFYKLIHRKFAELQHDSEIILNGQTKINNQFKCLADELPDSEFVEVDKSYLYDSSKDNYNMFDIDRIHYLPESHEWFSDYFFKTLDL